MSGLLESILNPPETNWCERERVPVYRHKDYVDALEKHYRECGVAFDRSLFEIDGLENAPTVTEPPERQFPDPRHVPVTLTVMKNNKVKVTAHTAWNNLWERYYDKGKSPPLRALVQAYKAVGCDDDFLKNIIKRHDQKIKDCKAFARHIQKIFNKPKKSSKKQPKEEEVVAEDPDPPSDDDDDEEDQGGGGDEEGFDMETGEEDDATADDDDDVVLSDVDL